MGDRQEKKKKKKQINTENQKIVTALWDIIHTVS